MLLSDTVMNGMMTTTIRVVRCGVHLEGVEDRFIRESECSVTDVRVAPLIKLFSTIHKVALQSCVMITTTETLST